MKKFLLSMNFEQESEGWFVKKDMTMTIYLYDRKDGNWLVSLGGDNFDVLSEQDVYDLLK